MKLVLQCAMCGTVHAVGTLACSTCRASGVTQLRLMFECPTCAGLGLNPTCGTCPPVVPLELDDELIVAEEVTDEPISLDEPGWEVVELDVEYDPEAVVALDLGEFDASEFELVLDDEDGKAVIVEVFDEDEERYERFDEDDEDEDD